MRLWIGLHLPQLPLEVFCPTWSVDKGAIVFERERVLALSAIAGKAGVRIGMRSGGVHLLLPQAQRFARDAEREQAVLYDAALAMLQYSPQLAQAEEATLLLDVGASLALFGGIRALCRRIRADLRVLGLSGSLSCAPTARGAWLLARHRGRRPRLLQPHSLRRQLDRLPLSLLPPARPFLDWFDGIACRDLGSARRLPRPGLMRRCGQPLLAQLDCAYGEAAELFEWLVAAPQFRARLELFERVEQGAALLHGAARLLLQMTGWLCAMQYAVTRITIELEHERGRVAVAPTSIALELAEASWRDEHLLRLLREKLGALVLPAPVLALSLTAADVVPMTPPSASLFPEPGGSPSDRRRLLELLVARLGAENVLQPAAQADYRPEVANAWVPLKSTAGSSAGSPVNSPTPLPGLPARPVWLLGTPQALAVRDQRPYYRSPLRLVSKPERIECGWWSTACARDYFVAEDAQHVMYWIYRERFSADETAARWYLHGLFG